MAKLERLLTPHEVAELTRLQIDTLYRLARRGDLPFLKLRGRLRFRRSDVRRWLDASAGSPRTTTLKRPPTVTRPRPLDRPSPSPRRTTRRGGRS
jgi:excisionase family DNA binding protein